MIEFLKNAKDVITLALFFISIIMSLIIFFLKKSKNQKMNELASKLESASDNMKTINSQILNNMMQVEKFLEFTSEDKKKYVITKVVQYCIENNIEYTEQIIEEAIEIYIKFSKTVNVNDAIPKEPE